MAKEKIIKPAAPAPVEKKEKAKAKQPTKVERLSEQLEKIQKTNGDLYDYLAVILDDIEEALEGNKRQAIDLVDTIDELKAAVVKKFKLKKVEYYN
jgi:hypothetical protein